MALARHICTLHDRFASLNSSVPPPTKDSASHVFVSSDRELLASPEQGTPSSRRPSSCRSGRPGSVAHMRQDSATVAIAIAPERRRAGLSGREARQMPRPRKLTPEQEDAIRAAAADRPLRELADKYGVSHETIRTVL